MYLCGLEGSMELVGRVLRVLTYTRRQECYASTVTMTETMTDTMTATSTMVEMSTVTSTMTEVRVSLFESTLWGISDRQLGFKDNDQRFHHARDHDRHRYGNDDHARDKHYVGDRDGHRYRHW